MAVKRNAKKRSTTQLHSTDERLARRAPRATFEQTIERFVREGGVVAGAPRLVERVAAPSAHGEARRLVRIGESAVTVGADFDDATRARLMQALRSCWAWARTSARRGRAVLSVLGAGRARG